MENHRCFDRLRDMLSAWRKFKVCSIFRRKNTDSPVETERSSCSALEFHTVLWHSGEWLPEARIETG